MSKLVRLEDVKQMIEKLQVSYFIDSLTAHILKDDVLNSLSSLPTQNEWIPVSERLPEESGEYLIVRESGIVSTLEFDNGTFHWEGKEPMYGSRPTKWMPLPPTN